MDGNVICIVGVDNENIGILNTKAKVTGIRIYEFLYQMKTMNLCQTIV